MKAISFAVIITFNQTFFFSKQEIIDCSLDYGNFGCDGGTMEYCFEYGKDYNI